MQQVYVMLLFSDVPFQLRSDHHRAVMAAGSSNPDGEIGFAFSLIKLYQEIDHGQVV